MANNKNVAGSENPAVMDDGRPRRKQDVFTAGPTPFLFVTFSLGAAKKKFFNKTKVIQKPNRRDEPPPPQPVLRSPLFGKKGTKKDSQEISRLPEKLFDVNQFLEVYFLPL